MIITPNYIILHMHTRFISMVHISAGEGIE